MPKAGNVTTYQPKPSLPQHEPLDEAGGEIALHFLPTNLTAPPHSLCYYQRSIMLQPATTNFPPLILLFIKASIVGQLQYTFKSLAEIVGHFCLLLQYSNLASLLKVWLTNSIGSIGHSLINLFKLESMAANYSSSDSDLEKYCRGEGNIEPYAFQPLKKKRVESNSEDNLSMSGDSLSSDSEHDSVEESRLGNANWCRCGHCHHILLVREKEYICCQERFRTRHLAETCDEGRCLSVTIQFHILFSDIKICM